MLAVTIACNIWLTRLLLRRIRSNKPEFLWEFGPFCRAIQLTILKQFSKLTFMFPLLVFLWLAPTSLAMCCAPFVRGVVIRLSHMEERMGSRTLLAALVCGLLVSG